MDRKHDALEVVMTWGGTPQHGELFDAPCEVTVGDGRDATFVLPAEVVPCTFSLVEPEQDAFLLCIPAGAAAQAVRLDETGARHPIDLATIPSDAEGTRRVRMAGPMIAEVEIGAFRFHVRTTDGKVEVPKAAPIDWRSYRWVAASFLFHATLIGIFLLQPPDAGALSLDLDRGDLSRMRYYMAAIESDQLPPDDSYLEGDPGAATNEGRPMEGDEGSAGARDERRNTGGRVAVRGPDDDARVPLEASDVQRLSTLGAIAAAAMGLSELSSPFGAADARGWAEESAYGPLMADSYGWAPGNGGWGMIGTGRGGCPAGATNCGLGTVGTGDLDTVGSVGGCSRGDFQRFVERYGRAGAMDRCNGTSHRVSGNTGLTRGGGAAPPVIHVGEAEPVGGLSKEQVRRVVRRNIAQVRHCYEQALQSRPDLEGRVSVQFIVAQSGAVMSSQVVGSDMSYPRVGECVQQAVRRWAFPQSPGVTSVTYPFRFTTP